MTELLLLLLIANGSPILVHHVMKQRYDYPIDCNVHLFDQQRLFGPSKTWRGLLGAIIFTVLIALLVNVTPAVALQVALLAMLGDLLSSFIKRRLGMAPSSMAPLLDQVPESLLPAIILAAYFKLTATDILSLVIVFIMLELLISRVLYILGVRRTPY